MLHAVNNYTALQGLTQSIPFSSFVHSAMKGASQLLIKL